MIKYFAIGLAAVALATVVYSASITGTAKAIGGGSTSVPHCQVSKSVANFVSGAIDTLDATVTCDETATYTVKATTSSGASSSTNQTAAALTADTATIVNIDVAPNVDPTTPDEYSVVYEVTK